MVLTMSEMRFESVPHGRLQERPSPLLTLRTLKDLQEVLDACREAPCGVITQYVVQNNAEHAEKVRLCFTLRGNAFRRTWVFTITEQNNIKLGILTGYSDRLIRTKHTISMIGWFCKK